MAGHSHAKNVMHKKAAQNGKKAQLFTKFAKMIYVAIKTGASSDPEANYKLRHALKQAQEAGVPKDIVKKAIEKTKEQAGLEEVLYGGYSNNGIAILIEAITNNKTKTAAEFRSIFAKHAGNMGETSSVEFLFDRFALIECSNLDLPDTDTSINEDLFLDEAITAGALEIENNFAFFKPEDFHKAQDVLEKKFKIIEAQLCYIAKNPIETDNRESMDKLISALEENENTQTCWNNLTN